MTNFVLCIHVQIRFASTEKNYSHRLACILFLLNVPMKRAITKLCILYCCIIHHHHNIWIQHMACATYLTLYTNSYCDH